MEGDELEVASAALEGAAEAVEIAESVAENAQEAAQRAQIAANDAEISAQIVTQQAEERVEEIQQEAAAAVAETIIDHEAERIWMKEQVETLSAGMTALTATVLDLQQSILQLKEPSMSETPNPSEPAEEDNHSQETPPETSSERAEQPEPEPAPESQRPKRHRPRY